MNRFSKLSVVMILTLLIASFNLSFLIRNGSNDVILMAAPLYQNPYSECPPNSNNIWIRLDTNQFGGLPTQTLLIPFDTGQVITNGHVYVITCWECLFKKLDRLPILTQLTMKH